MAFGGNIVVFLTRLMSVAYGVAWIIPNKVDVAKLAPIDPMPDTRINICKAGDNFIGTCISNVY